MIDKMGNSQAKQKLVEDFLRSSAGGSTRSSLQVIAFVYCVYQPTVLLGKVHKRL